MKVYHGTTRGNARSILKTGFHPIAWFTTSVNYAQNRAKRKAGGHNRAVVLVCDIHFGNLREQGIDVWGKGGIYAVRKNVPPAVIRGFTELPLGSSKEKPMRLLGISPKELTAGLSRQLAKWANELLDLKPYKGVSPRHHGVNELARWVRDRYDADLDSVPDTELLHQARRWLPEFFEGVEFDRETLRVYRRVRDVRLEPGPPTEPVDPREKEALDCLATEKPKRRIRGLKLLAELDEGDLFDWCAMFLNDESEDVVVTALQMLRRCEEGDPEVLLPFADSEDRRIRAAAIATLTKHSGDDAPYWFERGLKDQETCVRLEVAALLPQLDPTEHYDLFELARYDPSPEVKRIAQKFTVGKGFHDLRG